MAGKEVIRAAQMFTTSGVASRTSVVKEIVIGMTLGLIAGGMWQVRSQEALRSKGAALDAIRREPRPSRETCASPLPRAPRPPAARARRSPRPLLPPQSYHWNESAKWENYYHALEEKRKEEAAASS
jgi:hypothetical protein